MNTNSSDPFLSHQWILAGIASASARFIPLPFVDDIVRTRSRQFAVARTLAAHGFDYPSGDLAPLYGGDTSGWVGWTFRKAVSLPIKLALYPVRKLVKIFGSVRGVPLDLMQTVLIARTLDRCIGKGMFDPSLAEDERAKQAGEVRLAFESAFDGIDWIVVRSLMSDTMLQVKHWKGATAQLAQQIFAKDATDPERLSVEPLDNDKEIAAGAAEVKAMLEKPETLQLIADFDQRVDAALL